MESLELIKFIESYDQKVLVGSFGYDTRATLDGKPLPVAHEVGYADGRETIIVERGDLLGALERAPQGAKVSVPNYWGASWEGTYNFFKARDGLWVEGPYESPEL